MFLHYLCKMVVIIYFNSEINIVADDFNYMVTILERRKTSNFSSGENHNHCLADVYS